MPGVPIRYFSAKNIESNVNWPEVEPFLSRS